MKVFVQVDDCVWNTTLALIQTIYDESPEELELGQNYVKISASVLKWLYSVPRNNEVAQRIKSDAFYLNISTNDDFYKFYKDNKEDIEFHFVVKGPTARMKGVKDELSKLFPDVPLEEINTDKGYVFAKIDMKDSIYVDTVESRLRTSNANIKILYTGGIHRKWNETSGDVQNLYTVKDWKQAGDIIKFAKENDWWFKT